MESTVPNVLIVDDDAVTRGMLAITLDKAGYRHAAATDGPQALRLCEEGGYDLILLDVSMPGMTGLEVCRELKANPLTRNIPIVFLTAQGRPEDIVAGMAIGAVDYVSKPFHGAELTARVRNHIELKQNRDALLRINEKLRDEIQERMRYERKQEISIDLARRVSRLVNSGFPGYLELGATQGLCLDAISVPCNAEGGDHYFARELHGSDHSRIFITLKDQSGHEVSCLLRSILADLMHHALLSKYPDESINHTTTRLNEAVCHSGLFEQEDFFTGICALLDSQTLRLSYVSAGHPSPLFVRGGKASLLPAKRGSGGNPPLGIMDGLSFSCGEIPLERDDAVIFYTDGLTEMTLNHQGKCLEPQELVEMLQKVLDQNPRQSISVWIHELLRHITELSDETVIPGMRNTTLDDVSLVGIAIEDPSNTSQVIWTPQSQQDLENHITELAPALADIATRSGFTFLHDDLRTVLEEAALNAWEHGNRKDPSRSITIRWRTANDFHIEVEDQGEGFSPEELGTPLSGPNKTLERGRGIFMISRCARFVRWTQGGRCIHIGLGRYPKDRRAGINPIPRLWY